MATTITRPFAHNPNSPIDGTLQVGNLAIGDMDTIRYDLNYGGVKWWMGPDESNNYIIAEPLPGPTEPTPVSEVFEWFSFLESTELTDSSFLFLFNSLPSRVGLEPINSVYDAYSWLTNNGYWTSYHPVTRTATPTPTTTNTPTPTPTTTNTPTPTNTNTPTPTNTNTPTTTVTATNTNTPTPTNTTTPTNTPTQTQTVTPTPSITATNTPTVTNTNTPTPSITTTNTPTATNTNTPTPSITATNTVTPTPSTTPVNTPATVLLIGGGGGGGLNWGGGGGAGQVLGFSTNLSKNTTYTFTIGNGGLGQTVNGVGANGGTTSISSRDVNFNAVGGGGGGYNIDFTHVSVGNNGASGGGAGGGGTGSALGGSATNGYSGGTSLGNTGAGGGGGSSTVGLSGTSGGVGGNGGNGTTSAITGTPTVYAGGGGGGATSSVTPASGGTGGGGTGGINIGGAGGNATFYGSGGGGGGTNNGVGGNGYQGVAIISVPTIDLGTYTGNPTITTNGANTVLTFISGGTYTAASVFVTPTPTNTPNADGFNYTNFSSTAGLTAVGNVTISSNIYYLTTNTNGQIGNVYRTSAIRFNRNFSAQWNVNIGGGSSADGYCVQWTTTNDSFGIAGSGVGRIESGSTINALSFTTFGVNNVTWFKNNTSQGDQSYGSSWRQNMYYWFDYDNAASTGKLYISTTNTKPGSAAFTYNSFSFDSTQYYMGFGAATGGSNDNHELISWKLAFT